MKKKSVSRPLSLAEFIILHGISQSHLARRINMPIGTFKNKLSHLYSQYQFTSVEYDLIVMELSSIVTDLGRLQLEF